LIPIEIALKIANKIYANERFSAYIIIPMWPEGNPTGTPTQRILYWQVRFYNPLPFCCTESVLMYGPTNSFFVTFISCNSFISPLLSFIEKDNANDV
jgi:hypothetical protein